MKIQGIVAWGIVCSSWSCLAADLSFEWQDMVRSAAQEAKIHVRDSHTGIFGGVQTMTLNPSLALGQVKEGDAALMLYTACTKRFSTWAKEAGANSSTSNVSDGEMSLRIKAPNGDYLSALYRPPAKGGVQGTLTVVFVDADQFLKENRVDSGNSPDPTATEPPSPRK